MPGVFFGVVLAVIAVILRARSAKGRHLPLNFSFWGLLILSVLGSVLGFFGFHSYANDGPVPSLQSAKDGVDYSQILTVLALLAAAIVAGFFAFTFQEAAEDERLLATLISIVFILLFYIVFAAISFYVGKSPHLRNAPYATTILPVVMWLLLVANTLFEFWDYRESS